MGGTKSKVDGTSDEESDASASTSDSTNRTTEDSSRLHDEPGRNHKKHPSDVSSLSPDEVLGKPFTYRSRKDRLLESLNIGAGDSFEEFDSSETSRKGHAQNVGNKLQANLKTESSSTSTVKDVRKGAKYKKLSSGKYRKSSSKLATHSSDVSPTGVEEKIIETLIKPTKGRSVEVRPSAHNVHSKPVLASFDAKKKTLKPPEPPPIDFSDGSTEEKSPKPVKRLSTQTCSQPGNDLTPLNSILSNTAPSHLKELQLRFGNDVPRSPHEDNLNSTPMKQNRTENPSNCQKSASRKSFFTNNIPVADSLNILVEKPGVKSVDAQRMKEKKQISNEQVNKHKSSKRVGPDVQRENEPTLQQTQPLAGPKSIMKRRNQDGVIKCFPVETGMNEENSSATAKTMSNECRMKNWKTARTQTSSFGLVDSCVQTFPDLGLQGQSWREGEDNAYESAINNKAKKVLRRLDRSANQPTLKDKKGRRYRNGSTQWEEVDLLDSSLCSKLNKKGTGGPRPHSGKSRVRIQEKLTSDCDCQNEVCCMHLQVIPSSSGKRSTSRVSRPPKDLDDLGQQERIGESQNCKRCPHSGPCSSEKLTAWATYSSSRELSLLSEFPSSSTVKSKNGYASLGATKEDVYRQMEELGLGFLREGEWVPTDVISRTLWRNLEKCTDNCQATWSRRRSRSLTHSQPLNRL